MPSSARSSSSSFSRRTILHDYITMLIPSPITNSGTADGGWMDRQGLRESGVVDPSVHQYMPGAPMACYLSNDAYAREGFAQLTVELHPPLECVQERTTRESLTEYLETFAKETSNYNVALCQEIPLAPIEDPPRASRHAPYQNRTADSIVHLSYRVGVEGAHLNPHLSSNLTATNYLAVVHFKDLGNVLVKARNFERHSPPLNCETLVASIVYNVDKGMYRGPDPELQGIRALSQFIHGTTFSTSVFNRTAEAALAAAEIPECLTCTATSTPTGGSLLTCAKCKRATYCSVGCQKLDWKRHKRTDCKR